jgi:hypothetical protein
VQQKATVWKHSSHVDQTAIGFITTASHYMEDRLFEPNIDIEAVGDYR